MATDPTILQASGGTTLGDWTVYFNSNFSQLARYTADNIRGIAAQATWQISGGQASGKDLLYNTTTNLLTLSPTIRDAIFVTPACMLAYGDLVLASSAYTESQNRRLALHLVGGSSPSSAGPVSTEIGAGLVLLTDSTGLDMAKAGQASGLPWAVSADSLGYAFEIWQALPSTGPAQMSGNYGTVCLADSASAMVAFSASDTTAIAATPYAISEWLSGNNTVDILSTGDCTFQNGSFDTLETSGALSIGGDLNIIGNINLLGTGIYSFLAADILQLMAGSIETSSLTIGNLDVGQLLSQMSMSHGFVKFMIADQTSGIPSAAAAYASEDSQTVTFAAGTGLQISGSGTVIEGEFERPANILTFSLAADATDKTIATQTLGSTYGIGATLSIGLTYRVRATVEDEAYTQTKQALEVFLDGLYMTPGVDYTEDTTGTTATTIQVLGTAWTSGKRVTVRTW